MWLADSSGLHAGRHTSWAPTEEHIETNGARPAGWIGPRRTHKNRLSSAQGRGEGVPRVCMWNSARRLGRSHWELDTVLHVELRDELKDELLATAEVRLHSAHRRRAQTPRPSDLPFPQPRVHR